MCTVILIITIHAWGAKIWQLAIVLICNDHFNNYVEKASDRDQAATRLPSLSKAQESIKAESDLDKLIN